MQLCDQPVIARLPSPGLAPGLLVKLRLLGVDQAHRAVSFALDGQGAAGP